MRLDAANQRVEEAFDVVCLRGKQLGFGDESVGGVGHAALGST